MVTCRNTYYIYIERYIPEVKIKIIISVRTWKNKYTTEPGRRKRTGGDVDVSELPQKKRVRPLLLGLKLDCRVQAYSTALREIGAVINTAITIACAEGMVEEP